MLSNHAFISNNRPLRYNDHSQSQHPHYNPPATYPKLYTMLAQTPQQQICIRNNLTWRQATSMPIIKVVNFTTQQIKQSNQVYAQQFNIQLESIVKNVRDMGFVDIAQAIYMIREFLLGVQTISIKFNCQFDLNRGFFGLNSKGQAKVWLSYNFISDASDLNLPTVSLSNKKVYHVVDYLFQIVEHCVKPTQKATFQQLCQRIVSQQNVTFAEAHNRLRKISGQLGITISNSILSWQQNQKRSVNNTVKRPKCSQEKSYKKASINRQMGGYITKKQLNIFVNPLPTEQPKSSYNSPRYIQNNTNISAKRQDTSKSKSKSKYNWHFNNSTTNKAYGLWPQGSAFKQSHNYKIQSANNSIKKFHPRINNTNTSQKQTHIFRTVPLKFQDSQYARKLGKQPEKQRQQIVIKQFNPLEEDQNITSTIFCEKVELSMENYNRIRNQMFSDNKESTKSNWDSILSFNLDSQFMDPMNISKKSLATTYASSNTQRGKDSVQQFKQRCINKVRLDQMVCQNKTVANSIMIPTPVISRTNEARSRAYNFGGLIPIQGNPSSQNTEIEGKQAESFQAASIDQKLSNSQRIYELSSENKKIQSELLYGLQTTAKLFMVNPQDLKQSVWCGAEDKRAEHLQVKLSKLGNFGRQITQSIIPE